MLIIAVAQANVTVQNVVFVDALVESSTSNTTIQNNVFQNSGIQIAGMSDSPTNLLITNNQFINGQSYQIQSFTISNIEVSKNTFTDPDIGVNGADPVVSLSADNTIVFTDNHISGGIITSGFYLQASTVIADNNSVRTTKLFALLIISR